MTLWRQSGLVPGPLRRLCQRTGVSRPITTPYSTQPPWLESILAGQQGPPPKLYAWSPTNVRKIPGEGPAGAKEYLEDQARRIYIVGVGNLGRLYASCLRQHPSQPPITLVVHRRELLSAWAEGRGIEITRNGTHEASKDFDIEWWGETAPEVGSVREVGSGSTLRSVIVGTKAADAVPQVDRMRRYLDGNSAVAFVQNGMCRLWPPHGREYVARRFAAGCEPSFLACVTNHGVFSQGPFRSVHASPADVAVGPVLNNSSSSGSSSSDGSAAASRLTELLVTTPHLNARSVSRADVWVLQLQKLMINSVINPLTAVLRCKNGELFTEDDGPVQRVMERLLVELSFALQALVRHESSTEILRVDGQRGRLGKIQEEEEEEEENLEMLRDKLVVRFSLPELRQDLYRVGEVVAANTSSMLQDVIAGKPTEIHDLNGWLIDTISCLDLEADMPAHRALIDLVEARRVMDPSELARLLLAT